MPEDKGLSLEFTRPGRNGTVTLTARLGNEILHVEKLDLTKSRAREKFVGELCKGRPGIDSKGVREELLKIAADITTSDPADDRCEESPTDRLASMPKATREAARAMLESPDLLKMLVRDIHSLGVAGERELGVTIYLIGVSRLLPRPAAAIVQGPTASGKTYLIEKVASLFPPEVVIYATQMTPQALFHMRPGSLEHRFVVAGERSRLENDESAEATRALREMISSGKLTKLIPMKTGNTFSAPATGPCLVSSAGGGRSTIPTASS